MTRDASNGPTGRILLTGGSGFIGRGLSRALSGRWDVLTPAHRELDLTDFRAVESFLETNRVDAIVHGATKPGHRNAADPTGLLEANTRMYLNLTRRQDLCSRVILLGTGAVYDPARYEPKMPESHFGAWIPADEPSYSKYVVSRLAENDPRVTELRLFGVFGPGEDYAIRFISNAICKALAGLPITLRQDRLFDYLWVEDLAQVVEHFLVETGDYPAYNVTPDETVSLYDLACRVRDAIAPGLPIEIGMPGQGLEYSGDNSRLRAEMPGIRFTDIGDAIDALTSWYRNEWPRIDRAALERDL